jgi:hypothetical protein
MASGEMLTGYPLIDEDGICVVVPQLTPATGELSEASVNPAQFWPQTGGVPVLNAILVELRVISELLHRDRGAIVTDLDQMRAAELFNTMTDTGVV